MNRTGQPQERPTVTRGVPTSPGADPSLGAPIEAMVRLIRGRHKPDILIRLSRGRQRFGELRGAIPWVSERVLSRQLDELERDGLVDRTVYPEVPPRVEYNLTAFGSTLCPILKQMWKWGMEHEHGGSAETKGS